MFLSNKKRIIYVTFLFSPEVITKEDYFDSKAVQKINVQILGEKVAIEIPEGENEKECIENVAKDLLFDFLNVSFISSDYFEKHIRYNICKKFVYKSGMFF